MKRLWQLARRRKAVTAVVVLVVLEIAALPVVYWRYAVHGFPFHAFVEDFLVPRLVLGPWVSAPSLAGAPQRRIGNISMAPARWNEMFPADLILGWRLAPNTIARHGYDARYFVTNTQGFAITETLDETYAVPKPADVYRVIVIGGSVVNGGGVRDTRLAFPAKLLAELRQSGAVPGKKIEVINAGVTGYTINQEYLYLLTELVAYQPDLVIAYHGWGDFGSSVLFNAGGDMANPFRKAELRAINNRLTSSFTVIGSLLNFAGNVVTKVSELWSYSAFGHVVRSAASHLGIDLFVRGGDSNSAGPIKFNPRAAVHFVDMMRAMRDLARVHGFRLAMFFTPHGFTSAKPLSETEKNYMTGILNTKDSLATRDLARDFHAAVRKLSDGLEKRPDVCIGDLTDVFDRTRETVFIDSGHVNAAGEAIIAKRMFAELTGCGMFVPAAPVAN
jgi:lysophospholipase L1-like esterase